MIKSMNAMTNDSSYYQTDHKLLPTTRVSSILTTQCLHWIHHCIVEMFVCNLLICFLSSKQSSLWKWHEMYAQSPTPEMCIQTALYINWNQWPIFLVEHSRFKTRDSINHGTSTHRRSLPLNLIRRSQGSPISLHKCTSSTSTSRSGERHVLCVQQH